MRVVHDKNDLVIRVPMTADPMASRTGKTLTVARGQATVVINGRPVVVTVSAYIPSNFSAMEQMPDAGATPLPRSELAPRSRMSGRLPESD